jgi:hypothetical protein
VIKQTSRKKPKNDFYYEYYLLCPNPKCNTTYTVEEAEAIRSTRAVVVVENQLSVANTYGHEHQGPKRPKTA